MDFLFLLGIVALGYVFCAVFSILTYRYLIDMIYDGSWVASVLCSISYYICTATLMHWVAWNLFNNPVVTAVVHFVYSMACLSTQYMNERSYRFFMQMWHGERGRH